jgi:hypothetical protein
VPAEIANLFLGTTGGVCDDLEQKFTSPAAWKRRSDIEGFTILQIRLSAAEPRDSQIIPFSLSTSSSTSAISFYSELTHTAQTYTVLKGRVTTPGLRDTLTLPINACRFGLGISLGLSQSAVHPSLGHTAITILPIMCFLLHHAYHCHPFSPETLFLPCHLLTTQQPGNHAPAAEKSATTIKACPRLWEKRISSPNCVGCTATSSSRGTALREKDKEEVRRPRR